MNLPIGQSGRSVYQSHRLKEGKAARRFVYGLVISFILITAAWVVFASGVFDIVSPEIRGLSALNRGEVEREVDHALSDRSWRPWKKTNVLFIDKTKLAATLKDRLFVEDIIAEKSWPNILRLIIRERQRSVVLVSGDQYVNVDTTGVVTGEVDDAAAKPPHERIAARALADNSHVPVIQMPTADPLAPGFQIAQPTQVRMWLDFNRALVDAGFKFYFIKLEGPQASLARVVSAIKRDVYFDLTQPLKPQLETFEAYMKTRPSLQDIHEYLDVRVPGRVFTK